jgi:hypothetical protein
VSAAECASNKNALPRYAHNPDICFNTLTEIARITSSGVNSPIPNSVCASGCGTDGCQPISPQFRITLEDQYSGPAGIWGVEQDAEFSGDDCHTPTIVSGTHDCNIVWGYGGFSVSNTFCTDYGTSNEYRVAQANYTISDLGITSTERIYATMPYWMWNWTFTHNP